MILLILYWDEDYVYIFVPRKRSCELSWNNASKTFRMSLRIERPSVSITLLKKSFKCTYIAHSAETNQAKPSNRCSFQSGYHFCREKQTVIKSVMQGDPKSFVLITLNMEPNETEKLHYSHWNSSH